MLGELTPVFTFSFSAPPPPASFNTLPLTHVCNAMYAPYAQTHTLKGTCKHKVAMDLKTQIF